MHGRARLTPALLLSAYAQGLFPMAEHRDDPELFWVSPELRGIIPLDAFHISRRLARSVRSDLYRVTVDHCFTRVMEACAAPRPGREDSWINGEIISLYTALHHGAHAHSLECWQGDDLVGGLYGVELGGAFFGESMFSRARDASKIAVVHLVARLIAGGFILLDTQFLTSHLASFGAVEIPQRDYLGRLAQALALEGQFYELDGLAQGAAYRPAPSGNSGGASFAPLSGETGFTAVESGVTLGAIPGASVLQVITQTS